MISKRNPPMGSRWANSRPDISTLSYAHSVSESDFTRICVKGHGIGIVHDGAFILRLSASRQFLIFPPAIPLHIEGLMRALRAGAYTVTILEIDSIDFSEEAETCKKWGRP